jgi:cyanophycin synthetase
MSVPLPFDDSRRLTGFNLYFDSDGAVLETIGRAPDTAVTQQWRERVARACTALGWADGPIVVRNHIGGAALAFAAPIDQLYSATEVNEWAWLATLADVSGLDVTLHAPGHPAAWDEDSALHTLRAYANVERREDLRALVAVGEAHALTVLADEYTLSIGEGDGARAWPLTQLPATGDVAWSSMHDIPVALITGSNGKTTTVRLLAAMSRAHGWHTGHSCTDGVFVDGVAIETGDFSGPGGAREVLRQPQIEAAVLETARGGLLRRGLAVQRANVGVVTNVSADHFGEYGIHDLAALASVKLLVAHTLDHDGLLVLNADDAMLVKQSTDIAHVPLAWFALDDDHALLTRHREHGGSTCGMHDGHLRLFHHSREHDLGPIETMPLTFAGNASYNIANIAAAALAAIALGIAADTIAKVLTQFGGAHADNPGRLQHWRLGSLQVFVDYAHNPEGLRGLLNVASSAGNTGRLGLMLGQAGNREDPEIRELAAVAASFLPQRVVLKDIEGFMRGRVAGEVAGILRDVLINHAIPAGAVIECLDETAAVRDLLAWAREGDVLVLPTHGTKARQAVVQLLDALYDSGWRAGEPLVQAVSAGSSS